MIVYHGSNTVVQHPDVIHTCRNLDFGKGFYVTTVSDYSAGIAPVRNRVPHRASAL